MTVPLSVLAAGRLRAGWACQPEPFDLSEVFYTFEGWVNPLLAPAAEAVREVAHDSSMEWILMFVSVAVAGIGISVAYRFYQVKPDIPESLARTFQPLYNTLYHKWYVDEIYDSLFV